MSDDLLKLAELADRVEAATGADRGLDGWIHAHMTRGERYIIGNEPGRFPQEAIYGERMDVMKQLTSDPVGAAQYIGAPAYTASLDAAMSLVPEGWTYSANQGPSGKPHNWTLSTIGDGDTHYTTVTARAATASLAIAAAALKARARSAA